MSEMTGAESPELHFPPKPGGLVDTARRQAEASANAQAAAAPVPTVRKVPPVTVKVREPDLFAAKTMNIAAGASALAMPADPNRKHGALNLLTASASVIVARDRSGADTGTGYTMQSGNPPLELGHSREVWLHNPGDAAVQVSVLTESYESE